MTTERPTPQTDKTESKASPAPEQKAGRDLPVDAKTYSDSKQCLQAADNQTLQGTTHSHAGIDRLASEQTANAGHDTTTDTVRHAFESPEAYEFRTHGEKPGTHNPSESSHQKTHDKPHHHKHEHHHHGDSKNAANTPTAADTNDKAAGKSAAQPGDAHSDKAADGAAAKLDANETVTHYDAAHIPKDLPKGADGQRHFWTDAHGHINQYQAPDGSVWVPHPDKDHPNRWAKKENGEICKDSASNSQHRLDGIMSNKDGGFVFFDTNTDKGHHAHFVTVTAQGERHDLSDPKEPHAAERNAAMLGAYAKDHFQDIMNHDPDWIHGLGNVSKANLESVIKDPNADPETKIAAAALYQVMPDMPGSLNWFNGGQFDLPDTKQAFENIDANKVAETISKFTTVPEQAAVVAKPKTEPEKADTASKQADTTKKPADATPQSTDITSK